jgi:uncharacterized protein YlaN (UPF0358 family)
MKRIEPIVLVIVAIAYGVLITAGVIQKDNRLGALDLLAISALLFAYAALRYPVVAAQCGDFLKRVSKVRMPGNIEIELQKIKERQDRIDSLMGLLAQNLSMPQKYHLRALLRDSEIYEGRDELRSEFIHLKRLGLIETQDGQSIADILDGKSFELKKYVKLTESGEVLARSLRDIDGHD